MKLPGNLLALAVGVGIGVAAAVVAFDRPKPAEAASSDRYQDYVMATGAVSLNPRVQSDGVWLLDSRSGKLLGTVIDKSQRKIVGWAEVDLVGEFEIARLPFYKLEQAFRGVAVEGRAGEHDVRVVAGTDVHHYRHALAEPLPPVVSLVIESLVVARAASQISGM